MAPALQFFLLKGFFTLLQEDRMSQFRSFRFLISLTFITTLGLSACTYVQAPPEEKAPAPEVKADTGPKFVGCGNDALKDEPLCKFVAVKNSTDMLINGKQSNMVVEKEYSKSGQLIAEKFVNPTIPGSYYSIRTVPYSPNDGKPSGEEWLHDNNSDGKFDQKIVAIMNYENGKEKDQGTQFLDLTPNGPVLTGWTIKKWDYSQPNTVKTQLFENSFTPKITEVNTYKDERLEKKTVSTLQQNPNLPPLFEETEYTYTGEGKLETEDYTHGTVVKVNGVYVNQVDGKKETTNAYDASGRLETVVVDEKSGLDVLKRSTKKIHQYDERGNLISQKAEIDSNGDLKADGTNETIYQYDEFNNQFLSTLTAANNNNQAKVETTVEYKRLYKLLGEDEPQVAVK